MGFRPWSALKRYLAPPASPQDTQEDPFEAIKKAVNSVTDQFSKLSSEFGAPRDLNLSPNALPDKSKIEKKPRAPRKTSKTKVETVSQKTDASVQATSNNDPEVSSVSASETRSIASKKVGSSKISAPKSATKRPASKKPASK